MSVKNILFLDKVFLRGKKTKAVTGAERFNLYLIKELAEQGHHITIYATDCWREDIETICGAERVKNYSYKKMFRVAWPNAVMSVLTLIFVDRRKYDVVLMGNVGRIVLPIIKFAKFRLSKALLVLIAHREPTPLYIKLLEGLKIRTLAVNKQIAESFKQAGFSDTEVYYGEVQSKNFQVSVNNKDKDGIVDFCVFGNLDSVWKGSDVAVEAFRALPEEVKSRSKLHLAGYSKKVPSYEEENIITYPWLTESEVPDFLNSMDIALFPSRDEAVMKETFSQSSVQAMLAGLPLVVSTIPVLKEKVEHGGGLVFKGLDDLTNKMEKLYTDKELRASMGEKARQSAKEHYSWSTEYFVERFLN